MDDADSMSLPSIYVKFIVYISDINYIDMMKITLRQIEVFVFIAKLQTMTAAADALALTQSACSMALSNLEAQLGTALFDRRGKSLLLNDQGRAMLTKAESILAQVTELEISAIKGEISGDLVIGASSTIGNYLLPSLIGRFMKQHSKTRVSLSVSNTETVIEDLLNFKVDIALIEGRCTHPDVELIPWMTDELIIIAPPNHPLATQKSINLKALQTEKWIFRELGSGTRDILDDFLQGSVNPFMTLGNTEAIKQAVIAGLGISCVSRLAVANELSAKQLVQLPLKHITMTRSLTFALHREKYRTRALSQFMTTLA